MSNKPTIPSWQRASVDSPSSTASEQAPEQEQTVQAPVQTEADVSSTESDDTNSESTELVNQAARFLEDPSIRDAPREKKVAFLESKGVKGEDIETLLSAETKESGLLEIEEAGERAWSTVSTYSQWQTPRTSSDGISYAPLHTGVTLTLQAPPKTVIVPEVKTQPRDIPPIVTYPEFLATSEKPPPIMTTKRLLTTAYVTGGLMASMYGLSKYIIAPMTETLAQSRHDFASHTETQLKDFNERLGKAVSVDPASKAKTITDIADDVSEADSDPTELYHRDFGTQTTPTLSRRPSTSSPTDTEPAVTAHENRLKIIKSHLQEIESNRSNDSSSRDSLKTKVSELTTYLNDMSYQNQYYSNMNGFYGSNYGLPGGKDGKNDQIEVVKSDIRAVKGVFLSARNFPAGGRNTPPMPTGRVGA